MNMDDIFSQFGDIFGDIFGGGGSRRGGGRSRARTGADLVTETEVTFEEAAFGGKKILEIPRSAPCKTCQGSGAKPGTEAKTCSQCQGRGETIFQQGFFAVSRTCAKCQGEGRIVETPCGTCRGSGHSKTTSRISLTIPAGIESGQRLKLSGEGEAGERGGPSGDLYVTINVADHPIFERQGADIICEVPITFPQAALGTEIEVPSLEGKVKLRIPQGTQSHKIFRMRGKGLQRLQSHSRGDQLVRVLVETPTHLTPELKELLKKLEQTQGEQTHPMHKSFFDKVRDLFG
jgi:molecular chaperone DnaJ